MEKEGWILIQALLASDPPVRILSGFLESLAIVDMRLHPEGSAQSWVQND
jgi:hypothetical protein